MADHLEQPGSQRKPGLLAGVLAALLPSRKPRHLSGQTALYKYLDETLQSPRLRRLLHEGAAEHRVHSAAHK